jgi:hypothetical protein
MTRKLLAALLLGYVVLAVLTRLQEARGKYTCGCDEDCWCQQPGLSLFRWVFPRGHRNAQLAAWKRSQLEPPA